jgi:2-phosphosulfolactate phosphatase
MQRTVVIDCIPESARLYRHGYAIVAVDVIRATTSAVTIAAMRRRCFPVPSREAALALANRLKNPLLVGELHGDVPGGFHMNNSPAELAQHTDLFRPVVLLSSSGTRLIHEAHGCEALYLACFRNHLALAAHLLGRHARVALIGAGSRGEFREEDQICCAWIATQLIEHGYRPENDQTRDLIERWHGAAAEDCLVSESVAYLRRTGQLEDLYFVLEHVNDLDAVFQVKRGEVVMLPSKRLNGKQMRVAGDRKTRASTNRYNGTLL